MLSTNSNYNYKKYKISLFYLNGLKQNPKDLDFSITPSLVFGSSDKEKIKDLGFAYGLGIKWGYLAIGLKLFGVYITKH